MNILSKLFKETIEVYESYGLYLKLITNNKENE